MSKSPLLSDSLDKKYAKQRPLYFFLFNILKNRNYCKTLAVLYTKILCIYTCTAMMILRLLRGQFLLRAIPEIRR